MYFWKGVGNIQHLVRDTLALQNFKIKPLISSRFFSLLLSFITHNFTDMPPKRPHWDYTEDSVAKAILKVTENGMSVRKAGEKWGVPRLTISDRYSGQTAAAD